MNTEAARIVAALRGRNGVCFCPAHDNSRTPALSVRQAEDGKLLLHCFAGCEFGAIMNAVRSLGLIEGRTSDYRPPSRADLAKIRLAEKAKAEKKPRQAKAIWNEALPIRGTPAEVYLREARCITCTLPESLRFHPEAFHGPTARRRPAMVALIEGGWLPAIHRRFLRPDRRYRGGRVMDDIKDMQRAHALVMIKKADDETRTIRGIASTPSTDRQGDILLPIGAQFKLPFPLLWQHDHTQPVGEVIDARATSSGIVIAARFAAAGVSEKIDECWRLVKAGLVKGLSVGFIPLDRKAIPTGWQYPAWEIIELSCVTVASNPSAEILEVKRLDETQSATQLRTGGLPLFPAHLTTAERQAVLEMGARDAVDRAVAGMVQKTGKTEVELRKRFGGVEDVLKMEDMIVARWQDERIEVLEAKVAAMEAHHNG